MPVDRIRTLVVDDRDDIRQLFTTLLSFTPEFVVIGTARNGMEAIELARESCPDLILLDVQMPVMDGIAAVPHLREVCPSTKIVHLTALDTRMLGDCPPENQPDGVVDKATLPSELYAFLRKLMMP